ncbi:H(+)-transporting ATPase F(1) epsilon subunit [Lactobacillus pasteurii DSM 23907 = CRBIP 24.76]|uniref:ATP synthase epsilon chain n=1 Tax=Lactobacillus pasteurii DSM 23907 = CRBIP 24.76 TaxID=1423790 RepID=I7KLL7_9LACO|nr:F0F1 ATP synthase subunit epsilon [Lactobacillus pasteurii]KRK08720.1 H(+)-transporting ATPase F(1) epsilon subunit [Lactobacillus pasteurii DSM 23907 = CRBIP 24.76]TDG76454.1 hypothetical protein C5L33_001213 [Lactobacillus pasteurii]CCI85454.1 ATP synthase epsilon chain [Lactobacillus pasteurii DSM 23907 = CRBIP 24.76]
MAEPERLIEVHIVTPDGLIYSHFGRILNIRAIDGQREILYNHLPILTPLSIGDVKVTRSQANNGVVDHIAISGGYVEFSDNVATIIADTAERARNIDVSRAEAAKARAEKRMQEAREKHDQQSFDRAEIALRRAVNRIDVYNRR